MMSLGVDIGGSHVTASVIDLSAPGHHPLHLVRKNMDSFDTAFAIIESISNCIREILSDGTPISEVGIAFPGPFDYENGVSTIRNVGGKFEKAFGLHIKQALQDATGLGGTLFRFANDAHCFAVGAYARAGLSSERTIFLTLGTGFGSAFMENGRLISQHTALPAAGAFYSEPFLASIADDYFSTRWFHHTYTQVTGREIAGVQELAQMDSDASKAVFNEFGANLGSFLSRWVEKFECDELVIGGNISKAGQLFVKSLKQQLSSDLSIIFREDTEECILTGAAYLAKQESSVGSEGVVRNCDDVVRNRHIGDIDFDALANRLCLQKIAMIDGLGVASWEANRRELHAAFGRMGKRVFWYDINACLQPGVETDAVLREDSANPLRLFDQQKIARMQPDPAVDLCIVYGTGAALSKWEGELVQLDLAQKVKFSVV